MLEIHGFELCDTPLGTQLHTTSEDITNVGTPSMTVTLTMPKNNKLWSDFANQIVKFSNDWQSI
jgi:hypothetical protein